MFGVYFETEIEPEERTWTYEEVRADSALDLPELTGLFAECEEFHTRNIVIVNLKRIMEWVDARISGFQEEAE